MIYILTEEMDFSANYVCEWLNHYSEPFHRVNKNTNHNNIKSILLSNKGVDIKQDKLDVMPSIVWNRRGYLKISPELSKKVISSEAFPEIKKHLIDERSTLTSFIYKNTGRSRINNPNHYNSNKLEGLQIAIESGLLIPETIIIKNKKDLVQFIEKKGRVITKNIQDFASFKYGQNTYVQRTTEIKYEDLKNIPDTFFYSVFQELIERKFELRVFHFQGENYSVAISFPNNIVDSRYISNVPKRMSPFKLPKEINQKVNEFMDKMDLESGSIDLIYTPDGKYYFLEVNPVGQYDYVDKAGNFMLDKKIAKYLKNKSNEAKGTIQ